MSNERPTITVKLPYDHVLVINEYIDRYEWEKIIGIYREGKDEDAKAVTLRAEKRLYEMLGVILDGSTTETYDAIRKLPKPAYEIAVEVIGLTMNGERVDEFGKKNR